ncbi:3-methyladenine DNA glycosylase [Calidifontibacter terrae]
MTSVLTGPSWRALEATHQQRVDRAVSDHIYRRDRGMRHPIDDFLFSYYHYKPAQLRVWHPGVGVVLQDADERANRTGYHRVSGGVAFDDGSFRASKSVLVRSTQMVLRATLNRPLHLACFGMHEWAMAYRTTPSQIRHTRLPLRLGHDGTDSVVESHDLRCTHFDAYRFFTAPATPRNAHELSRASQPEFEQPGCLHAGMDLYKWAHKLEGLISSDLIMDCFDLAREIRIVDMRASPYDVSSFGHPAIPVETTEGKADYVRRQREFAGRADVLRRRLLAALEADTCSLSS